MVTTWVHDSEDLERGFARLDDQRLNAQRGGEGLIVARGTMARLRGEPRGWQQHPAVTMWIGHERALMDYQVLACRVWRGRGFLDYCLPEYLVHREELPDTGWPGWWGDHPIHRTHRLWLTIRRPQHYSRFPEFADVVDEAWDWMHEHTVDEEPPLTWPVSGVTTEGEGPSPLGRGRSDE